MPNQYVRPAIPYAAQPNPNNNRYSLIAGLNLSPSAEVFEGEANYVIDSMNNLYNYVGTIAAGILPGATNPANTGKFPITDGANPATITWANVTAGYLAAQCVGTAALVPGCVTTPILGAASVGNGNTQVDTVQNNCMVDDTISFNKITDENNVHFQQFFNNQGAGTLSGASMVPGSLLGTALAAGALPGTAITVGSLPAVALVPASLTNTQLAAVIRLYPGMMMDWAPGGAAPAGWLLASGQSLLRAAYPLLFAAIGVTYGSVDGTHFNLPDTRGRVIVGIDPTSGSPTGGRIVNNTPVLGGVGGAETVTLDTTQIPAHAHGYNIGGTLGISTGSGGSARDITLTPINTTNAGGGLAHNNMPPYLLAPKIIYAGV